MSDLLVPKTQSDGSTFTTGHDGTSSMKRKDPESKGVGTLPLLLSRLEDFTDTFNYNQFTNFSSFPQ